MSEYLYKDNNGPNLDHPDSAIRLASVVHRFKVPRMIRKVYYTESFRTVGMQHDTTRKYLIQSDDSRNRLYESCNPISGKLSAERIIQDTKRYIPYIHTLLISCKVQPEQARLDTRLLYEWKSGIENKPQSFTSEAMMYDLIMSVSSLGLGYAVSATERSVTGDFVSASRDYACAAGVFQYLATDQLPKWISKGSSTVNATDLPSECHAPMANALCTLFTANGQQMAIATVLMKDGVPNYNLVAKLCYGVYEQLEEFISIIRKSCTEQQSRMDSDFYTAVALQINIQKSLSLYFQARGQWLVDHYGIAIALLSEATVALKIRDGSATSSTAGSGGIPDVTKIPALSSLDVDLKDLRQHMSLLLRSWEKDNNSVYFFPVPQHVPATDKLSTGIQMNKITSYTLNEEELEPILLQLPDTNNDTDTNDNNTTATKQTSTRSVSSSSSSAVHKPPIDRSDSDLARQLQRQFDLEGRNEF